MPAREHDRDELRTLPCISRLTANHQQSQLPQKSAAKTPVSDRKKIFRPEIDTYENEDEKNGAFAVATNYYARKVSTLFSGEFFKHDSILFSGKLFKETIPAFRNVLYAYIV